MRSLLISALASFTVVAQEAAAPASPPYDPLRVTDTQLPEALLLDVVSGKDGDRTIPVRIQLPVGTGKAPVVLCSHGLGGNRTTCTYLADHWGRRGFVAVFLQHPGSDDSVWRDSKLGERMAAMTAAASAKNLLLRCDDVRAVLDRLAGWNGDERHALAGRLDLDHVGMSGHSFGAATTQATAGQSLPLLGQKLVDRRIDAAFAMSPSSPPGGDRTFRDVAVPWLLMTGTEDVSVIRDTDVESRLRVYPALPATIDRYELVLHGAEHSAFTERGLPGDRKARNPNHHRAILAISTAFWDTHLRGDAAARAWLHGDDARSVLATDDRWQHAHPEQSSVR